jgi:hypothetical protein
MNRIGLCVGFLAVLTATATAGPQPDPLEADRVVVDRVIRDSIEWALTKDRARLESIMAHDEDFFIFHPNWDDTVVGWDAFVPLTDFFMDPRFVAVGSDVRDLRIHFSRSGDVAWYSCILDDYGKWDGKPTAWKDTRWTGVLEKRAGEWVIVQMHFSFAADRVLADAEAKNEAAKE